MVSPPEIEGILQLVFDPAFVVDDGLRVTRGNAAAEALFGSTAEKPLHELLSIEPATLKDTVARSKAHGGVEQEQIRWKQGAEERAFSVRVAPVLFEAGAEGRVLVVLREQTSEQELRERIAEQETRLAEFHASTMELAMGASECFQVLTAMQQGDLKARVSENVLASSDELIANFGRSLNDTARELETQMETIKRQEYSIQELSTPILELWEDVLALPVIGIVDTQRSADMMERLLTEVSRKQAKFVILDITGVDVVDTRTADHFVKVIKAAQLIGATCVLTGIQPAVAQTLVDLGVDLGDLATLRNLRDGLRECIRRRGAGSGMPAANC